MRPLASSWEQRKLGDLISVYIAHAGPEEDVTVLTSSRDGIQKQEDHFGRLQQHDTSDWNLIPYGYCTYRNRSDDGLFTFNVNKVADRGIVSKFYPVFETSECDADFLVAYLNSSQEIRKKLFVLAVGTSQVVLSYGALKELSLLLPQNREQSAIANVLNHIDNLITLHQRKCQYRGLYGCLSWEQRKLGELIQLGGSGGTPSANNPDYYGGDIPFLSIADINGRDITNTAKTLTDEGLQNSAAWIVPSGAVSLAMYASVGKVGIIRQDTATSQAFYNMVFDNEALRDFVFTRLEKAETDSEWEPYISTGTQRNLNADKVKSFSLDVPSKEEASEISAYFANLDTLITLHQ